MIKSCAINLSRFLANEDDTALIYYKLSISSADKPVT